MREALLGFGIPEWQADGLIEDYEHYRRGEASIISPSVCDVTGHPPHSFADFARDYISRCSYSRSGIRLAFLRAEANYRTAPQARSRNMPNTHMHTAVPP